MTTDSYIAICCHEYGCSKQLYIYIAAYCRTFKLKKSLTFVCSLRSHQKLKADQMLVLYVAGVANFVQAFSDIHAELM